MERTSTTVTKNGQVKHLTLYHGSHSQHLDSILAEGLRAVTPPQSGIAAKGVYLTADFETAARYGVNMDRSEKPVVFAVSLDQAQTANLTYDLLDREDNAWSDDNDGDLWYENTYRIEEGARVASEALGMSSYSGYTLDQTDEEALNGLNIITWATEAIASRLPDVEREQVEAAVRVAYESDLGTSTDWFDIGTDGTLHLSSGWYESREQLISPQAVAPTQITEVWLRLADWDYPRAHYTEFKEAGIKDLPQESRARIDAFQSAVHDIQWTKFDELYDEDISGWITIFKDFDASWTEPVELLSSLLGMTDKERLAVADDFKEATQNWQEAGDEVWFESRVSVAEEWGRVAVH